MEHDFDLKEVDKKIQLLNEITRDLIKGAENFPALNRNCHRILASLKMLEMNVSDISDYC